MSIASADEPPKHFLRVALNVGIGARIEDGEKPGTAMDSEKDIDKAFWMMPVPKHLAPDSALCLMSRKLSGDSSMPDMITVTRENSNAGLMPERLLEYLKKLLTLITGDSDLQVVV